MKVFAVLLVLIVGTVLVIFRPTMASPSRSTPSPPPVTISLGIRPDVYGTTWQAQELLAAIDGAKWARRVTITASSTAGESLEFTADFDANTLTRKHSNKATETWDGAVMSRLINASKGDSLSNTR